MIGPRDVAFTAIAMRSSRGERTTTATNAMEKLTARFRRSDVRNACRRLSVGRLTVAVGAAATGSSKTGNDPVIMVLGSAPREAIRECPDERSRQPYHSTDLCQSARRLCTDLDRIAVAKRQLIEGEP